MRCLEVLAPLVTLHSSYTGRVRFGFPLRGSSGGGPHLERTALNQLGMPARDLVPRLRPGEVLGLTWDAVDIDGDEPELYVGEQFQHVNRGRDRDAEARSLCPVPASRRRGS